MGTAMRSCGWRHAIALATVGALFLAQSDRGAATEVESSIARGGRLYDNWMTVLKADKPTEQHPAWPASNTGKQPDVTWRCKNCHGWDYKGRDGAYATGTYKTGIAGISRHAGGDAAKVIAIISDKTHRFDGKLGTKDLQDLAMFVTRGQTDHDRYIDRASKAPKGGDAGKGAAYFNTMCAGCHGTDGRLPFEMPDTLAQLTSRNPWESLHKVANGQPGEPMPALRALDGQITADIMAYMVTLPKDKLPKPAEPAKQGAEPKKQ